MLRKRDEDLLEGGLADRVVADDFRGKQCLGCLHGDEKMRPGYFGVRHLEVNVVLKNGRDRFYGGFFVRVQVTLSGFGRVCFSFNYMFSIVR